MNLDSTFIENLRQDYRQKTLNVADVSNDPIKQFEVWLEEAIQADMLEPNAMTLATANKVGRPSARIVLLKGLSSEGFVFYTNYDSHKGQELAENPFASLVFVWLPLQRQVRITGKVEKITPEQSTKYFHSRPKGSQIGAIASPQSQIITDRSILENNVVQLKKQYEAAENIPRPESWGGYRVIPDSIEFWQGRSSRLHDRLHYKLQDSGEWIIERLAP